MGSLSFSPISEAFNITSESIVKQQQEINRIKEIIYNPCNNQNINQNINQNNHVTQVDDIRATKVNNNEVIRVNNMNNNEVNKSGFSTVNENISFEETFLSLIKNPRFDETFIKYVNLFKPDLINNSYKIINGLNESNNIQNTQNTQNMQNKEYFGKQNTQNTQNNFIVFFIIAMSIYLSLFLYFKK